MRVAIALAAAAAIVLCTVSVADAQSRVRCDVAGGVAFPVATAPITDSWGTGFELSAAVRMRAGSRFAVGPAVAYARFGFDEDAFESTIRPTFPNVNVGGNDLLIVSVLVDAECALVEFGNTRPTARAGIGWAHASHTNATASGPLADNVVFPKAEGDALTVRLGAGVRTLLTPTMTLWADVSWQVAWIDPDAAHWVPVRVGLRF